MTYAPPAGHRPVLIANKHNSVYFGYTDDTNKNDVKLKRARCAVYWPAENKGFVGLAVYGPVEGARITEATDVELRDVVTIAECTPEAVDAWEKAPWAAS